MKKETTIQFRNLCSRLVLAGTLLVLMIACESKGKIYGNISAVMSDKPDIEGTQYKRVKEMGVVKNTEVLLLKYTDALPTKHQQLFEECLKSYKKLNEEREKNLVKNWTDRLFIGGVRNRSDFDEAIDRGLNEVFSEFNEAQNRLFRECGNRRKNLIFVDMINKTTSGEDGIYEFRQIPYGKYFIAAQLSDTWWLVPVNLNDKEVRLELNDRNSFQISH